MPTRRRLALLPLLSLVAGLLTVLVVGAPAEAADKDCSDFGTQKSAQVFFLNHDPKADPHALDADGDMIACETNPCPCLYQKSPGKKSGGGTTTSKGKKKLIQRARVVRVIDGDTVEVRLAGGPKRDVRMIGIDTPEVYGGVECGGKAASRSLKTLLPKGTRVRLVSDTSQATKDRYGRILRYVVRAKTGKDLNRAQVARGHARVYVYGGKPFHRVADYRKAQRAAKAAPRGLWKAC